MNSLEQADYLISAVYFPKTGEVELTWQSTDTGEVVFLTTKVTPEKGKTLAKLIPPCTYHSASVSKGKAKEEEEQG